jgi:hypothetical protein
MCREAARAGKATASRGKTEEKLMRNEEEIVAQYRYYREKLDETNRKLQEAIHRENLKEIAIFKGNQVMFAERLMTLEWVLETVDADGIIHPYPEALF